MAVERKGAKVMKFFGWRLSIVACGLLVGCNAGLASVDTTAALAAFSSENPPLDASELSCSVNLDGVNHEFGVINFQNQKIPKPLRSYLHTSMWNDYRGKLNYAGMWVACSEGATPSFVFDADRQGVTAMCGSVPIGAARFAGREQEQVEDAGVLAEAASYGRASVRFAGAPIEVRRLSSGHCATKKY